jgi:hypothetical protein
MASRFETLTKQLGRTVLSSRAFADFVESGFDLECVGEYPVRGLRPNRAVCWRVGALYPWRVAAERRAGSWPHMNPPAAKAG